MKHYYLTLVTLFVFCASLFGQTASIYVSTNGNDNNDGTKSNPFKTIQRAIQKANNQREKGEVNNIHILIQEGTYRIANSLIINKNTMGQDSKTPILFEGVGKVTVSGGVPISFSGTDKIVSAVNPLDASVIPSDLYIDGKRATRARTPNSKYNKLPSNVEECPVIDAKVDYQSCRQTTQLKKRVQKKLCPHETVLRMSLGPKITKELSQLTPEELSKVSIHIVSKWDVTIRLLKSYDKKSNMFTTHQGKCIPSSAPIKKNSYYFVEGYQAALDTPGEWLNVNDDIRYFKLESQEAADLQGIVPKANNLIVIKGEPDKPMSHITFENINFAHSNLVLKNNRWDPVQAAATLPATIQIDYANKIQFKGCSFQHIGQFAIWMEKAVTNSGIYHSYFSDLGAGAIKIGSTCRELEPVDSVSKSNQIKNNIIHSGGRKLPCAAAVWIGNSSNNVVTQNDIGDFYYSGISVGWTLGYAKNNAHENEISYNEVQYIGGSVMSDLAGIYTMGVSPGTKIHNNVVHDISGSKLGYGIYLDEGSSDIIVMDNLVVRTTQGGFMFHYGQNNQIRNNMFTMGLKDQLYLENQSAIKTPSGTKTSSFNYSNNLIYYETGLLVPKVSPKYFKLTFSDNLFLGPNKKNGLKQFTNPTKSPKNIFEKNSSKDTLNTRAVLQFGHWSESLLSMINFQQVDWAQAGVTGAETWKDKAKLPVSIITAFEENNRMLYRNKSMYPQNK